MAERETWVVAPQIESVPATEKQPSVSKNPPAGLATSSLSDTGNFLRRAKKAISVAFTVLCFAVFGFIVWHAALFFAAPEFSEAKAQFEANGHAADGERMAELGKVCRNGSGTPLACELVYFHHVSGSEMVAEARRTSEGGNQRE